jgi:hypothetical protein
MKAAVFVEPGRIEFAETVWAGARSRDLRRTVALKWEEGLVRPKKILLYHNNKILSKR